MRKIYKYVAVVATAVVSLLTFQSCLFNQEDYFDDSASARMQKTLEETQSILQQPEYGWYMLMSVMNPSYGLNINAYVYTVQFDDTKATVACQQHAGQSETSYYKMTNDDGPILSFDTYNTILHELSTPAGSSSMYEGQGGEFEFLIMEASKDKVVMQGKREGLTITMYPLEKEAEDFLAEVRAAGSYIYYPLGIQVGDTKFDAELYGNTAGTQKYLYYSWEDENGDLQEEYTGFVFLPDRIELCTPITVGDKTLTSFTVDTDEDVFTPIDSDATIGRPWSYVDIDDYVGSYTLTYNKTGEDDDDFDTIDVSIVKSDEDGVLLLQGINDNWDIAMEYDGWTGAATISMQTLCQFKHTETSESTKETVTSDKYLRLCFATWAYTNNGQDEDISPDYFTSFMAYMYYTYCELVWDKNQSFMVNNYEYSSSYPNTTWYLQGYSSVSDTDDRVSPSKDSGMRFPNGSVYLPFVYSLTKK